MMKSVVFVILFTVVNQFCHAGCYPECPMTEPYFDEDTMTCVTLKQCGCYDDQGNHYTIGERMPGPNCDYWYVSFRHVAMISGT